MNAVQKLRQLTGEIQAKSDPLKALAAWDLARSLLGRMPVDQAEAKRAFDAKDTAALNTLVEQLEALDAQQRSPAAKKAPAPGHAGAPARPTAAASPATPPSPELAHQMDHALRAFRKRLKLTRLADESKLAGRRLTSGKRSEVDAILPPHEFPDEVWKALAAAGRLVHTGQGFYALAGDPHGHEEPL